MKLNLLKPLKRIFTALTGEETEDKNLVTIMDKIADTIEESDGSGGGGVMIVTVHYDTHTATLDKTWKEIMDAFISGKAIVFDDSEIPDEDSGFPYNRVSLAPLATIYVSPNPNPEETGLLYYISSANGGYYATPTEDGYPDTEYTFNF